MPEQEIPQPIYEQMSDIEDGATEATVPGSELSEIAKRRLETKLIQLMKQTKTGGNDGSGASVDQKSKTEQLDALSKELTGQRVEILELNLFESKTLDVMERLSEIADNKRDLAICLVGFDSSRAWALREKLVEGNKSASENDIALGLAGVESERAWEIRNSLLQEGEIDDVCRSLAGLNSPRSWGMRSTLLNRGLHPEIAIESLLSLDSEQAWNQMERMLLSGAKQTSAVRELAGNNSDRAWEMRRSMLNRSAAPGQLASVADSLVGLDNPRVRDTRKTLLSRGLSAQGLLYGLAGDDTESAWEIRDQEAGRVNPEMQHLSFSLAGLNSDRAWQMRKDLVLTDRELMHSINGGRLLSVGWRAARELLPYQQEQKEK